MTRGRAAFNSLWDSPPVKWVVATDDGIYIFQFLMGFSARV